jgi:hypothetical protein
MGVRPGGEHDEVEQRLKSAAARCRELGPSFRLALTLLEHSEWLIVQGRAEEGERTGARRGARDLGAPRGEALARACGAVPAAGADRGCDLIIASEAACPNSAILRHSALAASCCPLCCRPLARPQSRNWCGLPPFDCRSVSLSRCDSESRRTPLPRAAGRERLSNCRGDLRVLAMPRESHGRRPPFRQRATLTLTTSSGTLQLATEGRNGRA